MQKVYSYQPNEFDFPQVAQWDDGTLYVSAKTPAGRTVRVIANERQALVGADLGISVYPTVTEE